MLRTNSIRVFSGGAGHTKRKGCSGGFRAAHPAISESNPTAISPAAAFLSTAGRINISRYLPCKDAPHALVPLPDQEPVLSLPREAAGASERNSLALSEAKAHTRAFRKCLCRSELQDSVIPSAGSVSARWTVPGRGGSRAARSLWRRAGPDPAPTGKGAGSR